MARREELTDEQWAILAPLIPATQTRSDGRGRPQVHSDRAVLNGILWVLRTGAAWADLPDRFPSGCTCFRRFSRWVKAGVMRQMLEALARHLEETGQIDLSECFIDGTFVVAKKGDPGWERPSGARVRSSWLLLTLMVFHSPCTRLLLTHMKSPLSRLPSMKPSRWDDPNDLLGIAPTTVIRSMKRSQPRALN
jgi:transposase